MFDKAAKSVGAVGVTLASDSGFDDVAAASNAGSIIHFQPMTSSQ